MAPLLAHCFRSRLASLLCAIVVVLALVLPPNGFGVPLCQFRTWTGLPCLTCGLTRSFIAMAHLNLRLAAFFHPVGLLLFPLFVLTAALLFAPERVRGRVASWTERHPLLVNWIAGGMLALVLINGFGRIAWIMATRQPSPW